MGKIKYNIRGLDCADCALELEEHVENIDGISSVKVNFIAEKIEFNFETEEALNKARDIINNFEEVRIVENEIEEDEPSYLPQIIISSFLFVVTFILTHIFAEGLAYTLISSIGYGIAYIVVGYPILINSVKNIRKGLIFDENFLMSIASIAAILITIFTNDNLTMEASATMLLYQIGEFLQDKAVSNSRKTIKELVELKSDSANLVKDKDIVKVSPAELKIGDTIVINVGEKVPVDIMVLEGESNFDTKSLTGEAMPKYYEKDSEIYAGCINLSNVVKGKVIRTYENSAVAKILDLVENSQSNKAKPEKFITKFAKYYTPIVCIISLLLAVIGSTIESIITGNPSFSITKWVIRAVTVLVISCPCALVISIPLTYFSGIGACAKKGILVKGATNLDELSKIKVALFDKTGTLTYGKFEIVNSKSDNIGFMNSISSAIEKYSNHPISEAFKGIETNLEVTQISEYAGKGIEGYFEGKQVLLGNSKLLKEHNINFEEVPSINTVLYCSYNGNYLGYYEVGDVVKENIPIFIQTLTEVGIIRKVMLTGDNETKAQHFKETYLIDEVFYNLLPEDKMNECRKIMEKDKVLYVGDGINDTPVMKLSNVSFSMGKLGSDAAIEASDFVLISDDLMGICYAKQISKKTKKIVLENIIASISLKVIVMVLGAFGLIPLWLAVLADVGIMVLAVLNSLRVKL